MSDLDKVYTAYFDKFLIDLSGRQVKACSHQGECYEDVKATLPELNLNLDPDSVREELRGYGAWDETELSDNAANMIRIVWIAAGNIKKEEGL